MMRAPQMRVIGWTSLILATGLFVLAGCDDTELQKAKRDAARANAEVERLQLRLKRADREIQEIKAANNHIREMRDTLNDRVNQLAREKDKAATMAAQAQQTASNLTAKADSEADTMASLREKVAALNSLVATQQATIQQYQVAMEQAQQYLSQGPAGVLTPTTAGDSATESEMNQSQAVGGN
jgi:chromosome segregation ATPase